MIAKGNTGPNTSQGPQGTLGAIQLWARRSVHTTVVLGIIACGSQTDLATPPPPPPSSLVLQLKPDAEDLNTAAALGWTNGIPAAEVRLEPIAPTLGPSRTLQSAADGKISLEGLPPGRYEVTARRWLTVTERSQLPAGDDGIGFVSKSEISIPSSFALEVRLPASRRRALVLSEWAGLPMESPSIGGYFFSGYLRLYNNADTTVYLDGLIVGRASAAEFDYPTQPCVITGQFSGDPAGVWARAFQQLPGHGRDYPLPPGQTAVLATDAIDHRPFVLEYPALDLRAASFEFAGVADADNPAVPNAPDVGLWAMPFGHGLIFSALANVVFVSLAVDPTTLPRQGLPPFTATEYVRFPKAKLLEVVAIGTTYNGGYASCPRLVHQDYDRRAVQLTGANFEDFLLAYHRLTSPVVIGGRTILQHTRTSAADFALGDRTPFANP